MGVDKASELMNKSVVSLVSAGTNDMIMNYSSASSDLTDSGIEAVMTPQVMEGIYQTLLRWLSSDQGVILLSSLRRRGSDGVVGWKRPRSPSMGAIQTMDSFGNDCYQCLCQ
ncbi:hypothetical protein GUJ93_ZPchr0001g33150 [Zizania palustris]|uniref:Uncharacterized protein n=1 Tax=Zizania palustris TaxID=103762 RepID=A0A8J5VPC0_ZIZPA|nr:hypothetical protein GUJ93_ZPchr0001g33150 [Zizania palustris]